MRSHRYWLLGLLLAVNLAWAGSGGVAEVRKQVEASLVVTGSLDIEPDGRVSAHVLDENPRVTPALRDVVARSVALWRFEPVLVSGKPVAVRSRMSLRLTARRADGDRLEVRVAGAQFGLPGDADLPRKRHLQPPQYPYRAAVSGVGGHVYLALRVAPDGSVDGVVAEQVNLQVIASEIVMQRWREMLAASSVEAARKWRFDPKSAHLPPEGYWQMRIPVQFVPPERAVGDAAGWESYVPGPRQPVPWRRWDDAGFAPDAMADDNSTHPDRPTGPKLLTPLHGTAG